MSEMDDYYRLLGLNPGASEEEIKEAYKDLIKVWHPDRISNDPRLKEKANAKLREINLAYEVLKAYIAGKSEQSTASRERRNHAESQSPPREPSPKPDQEQTTAGVEGDGGFQPPPKQTSDQFLVKSIYAGFWNRFGAVFIDCIIIGIGGSLLSLPFLVAKGMSKATTYPFWMILDSIVSLLIGWLYCTLLESSTKQATIGKMAVGIIVTDLNGNRISFGRANGRWWGKSISFLILGIGYIMAGFTKKKQALHDIMADTLVIKKAERTRKWVTAIPVILSGIIVLGLIGLIFLELKPLSTEEPDSTITASAPPSVADPSSTTPSEDSTSKEDPFLTYLRKKERGELNPLFADIDIPKDMIWKLMAKNSQGSTFYYDTKYIIRLENINWVAVWTKTFYGDRAVRPEVGQVGKSHEPVTSSLEANQIDCVSSMAFRIRVFHYSKEGLCLGYSDTPSEWISIPPNSVLAVLQKEVCR